MIRLNDDCLFEIFSKMKLAEQLNMARVCIRFRSIIERILWPQFRFIDVGALPKKLKKADKHTLLQVTGPNLKRLDIINLSKKAKYLCDVVFYSTLDFDNLVELNLRSEFINDDHVRLFADKCKQLSKFSVTSPNITGDHISKMKKLKELRLLYCPVERQKLEDILAQLPLVALEITRNYYCVSDVLMETTITTLKQLTVSDVMYFGILLLEKLPLTSLSFELSSTGYSFFNYYEQDDCNNEYFKNLEPPNELRKIRSNLYKLTILDGKNCIRSLAKYLHNVPPEMTFQHFATMSFPNLVLHLIDNCSRLECIETLIYSNHFFVNDLNQFTKEIQKRKRSFRFVINCVKAQSMKQFKEYLQGSSVYNQQKEFTIEFKLFNDGDNYLLNHVNYYMHETNELVENF